MVPEEHPRPMVEPKFKLVERLFAQHSAALHQFFRRRLRRQWDAPDLTQEVYTRMLRVSEHTSIENPEAYLFTVASNLLRERAVMERKQEELRVPLSDPLAVEELTLEAGLDSELDRGRRIRFLQEAVMELSPKLQAVIIWAFEEGLTQEAIAERLGVSRRMARKHLAAAMEHCRRRAMREGVE
jgi:RNA polymerase sigma-70 factor (ECF subfamily)